MEKSEHQLIISLINDCPPLPDFVVERAFERYFSQPLTSNNPQNRSHKGTGLGLTLVKQVIDHHHGKVSFEQGKLGEYLTSENLTNHSLSLNQPCAVIKITLPLSIH